MNWTIPDELDKDPATVVPHYWNRRSDQYDENHTEACYTDAQLDGWRSTLDELAGGSGPALDVGTGTGFLALLLAEIGHEVTGIDVSEGMLENARQKASRKELDIRFLKCESKQTGLKSNTFELVIARLVLWNLPDPDKTLHEWIRLSQPGGTLAVIDGRDLGDVFGDDYHDVFGQLPFYGGMDPEAVVSLFERHEVHEIAVQSMEGLMADESGKLSDQDFYLVSGTVNSS